MFLVHALAFPWAGAFSQEDKRGCCGRVFVGNWVPSERGKMEALTFANCAKKAKELDIALQPKRARLVEVSMGLQSSPRAVSRSRTQSAEGRGQRYVNVNSRLRDRGS